LSISLPSKHDRSTATKDKQPIGKIERSFKHEYIPNINFKDNEQQRSQVEQILDAFTGQKGHRAEFKNNRFTVKDSTNKELDNVHFYFGCARPQAEVANDTLKYHDLRMIARESFEKLGILFADGLYSSTFCFRRTHALPTNLQLSKLVQGSCSPKNQ